MPRCFCVPAQWTVRVRLSPTARRASLLGALLLGHAPRWRLRLNKHARRFSGIQSRIHRVAERVAGAGRAARLLVSMVSGGRGMVAGCATHGVGPGSVAVSGPAFIVVVRMRSQAHSGCLEDTVLKARCWRVPWGRCRRERRSGVAVLQWQGAASGGGLLPMCWRVVVGDRWTAKVARANGVVPGRAFASGWTLSA